MIDFEVSMLGVLTQIYPATPQIGCLFHLSKNVFKHVQKLQQLYLNDQIFSYFPGGGGGLFSRGGAIDRGLLTGGLFSMGAIDRGAIDRGAIFHRGYWPGSYWHGGYIPGGDCPGGEWPVTIIMQSFYYVIIASCAGWKIWLLRIIGIFWYRKINGNKKELVYFIYGSIRCG